MYETYMTTTFFGASCAPEATSSGPPKIERFHVPLGASHVHVTAKPLRNPTRTVAAGTPPTTGCAPRYENSAGGGTGVRQRLYMKSTCAYRLKGAWREWSRNMSGPARVSSSCTTGAVLIDSIAYGAPPEYANTPPIGHTRLWSVLRTERTEPTRVGAWELKMAATRVYPPSTTSSYTTSACS